MANAAMTYVYNENVNLPKWLQYYGRLFGEENLFILDRGSDDGSTENVGKANLIKLPRHQFNEHDKTNAMSSFHRTLTSFYDAVIVTDCDEILVADPHSYTDLNDYIARMPGDYMNAIGIDVTHIITHELPIDHQKPILSQRRIGKFHAPECKHLLSKVPIQWLPGLHSSNKAPLFDENLFIFHLKFMDFNSAVSRQKTNLDTVWAKDSVDRGYGTHHRFPLERFVHNGFLTAIDLLSRGEVKDFKFGDNIRDLIERTVKDQDGNYRLPMDVGFLVEIPERFATVF